MKKSLKSGLKVHLEKFKSKKILAQGKGTPTPRATALRAASRDLCPWKNENWVEGEKNEKIIKKWSKSAFREVQK